ncbi:myelin protein zero-like 1 like isoform X1 [Polypterus senegalus]|uniref:myelin protein zero-like 1 like isoform X1 n=1 Tax=Polypterus senegalus TaxID=55291 RepID=UPI001963817E|nr:myelin protein zero-like 1 like isoform X1 [Polypterus senegalus]
METKTSYLSQILGLYVGIQLFFLAFFQVHALEVFTPKEVFFENGTQGTLHCTFSSTEVIKNEATVSWSFIPEGGSNHASFFYYSAGKPYGSLNQQFKDRISWAGDLNKKDASIKIDKLQFTDNGTYICDVKNPPDIEVTPGFIKLRVVEKAGLPKSNAWLIVGAVIGAILGVLLIVIIVSCLVYRRNRSRNEYMGCSSSESVVPQVTLPVKNPESVKEWSRCSSPSAPLQGPVIYAQLDHSGNKSSNTIYKSEPVVYADIRKN